MPLEEETEKEDSSPKKDAEADRLIDETRRMAANTRTFLDRLVVGEAESRRYIEELNASLENELRRLENSRNKREQQAAESGDE